VRLFPVLAALLVLWFCAGCTSVPAPANETGSASAEGLDPVSSAEWRRPVDRFAAIDATDPPPAHPIVFTGSSSIRMWSSLGTDFPGTPVLNRGFGGSQIRDVVWYADNVAIRYRPRQIVVYCGDNDIDARRSPQQVVSDFHAFVARIRRDLPEVPIAWISIKPSVARAAQLSAQREANALVKAAAAGMRDVEYVDVFTPMLDASGQPRPELFVDDGLHMNRAGYALWRNIIGPYLEDGD
jgi:lysophospholipase L1-like esterase